MQEKQKNKKITFILLYCDFLSFIILWLSLSRKYEISHGQEGQGLENADGFKFILLVFMVK